MSPAERIIRSYRTQKVVHRSSYGLSIDIKINTIHSNITEIFWIDGMDLFGSTKRQGLKDQVDTADEADKPIDVWAACAEGRCQS